MAASIGYLESQLSALPDNVRRGLLAFVRVAFKELAFGVPSTSPVACTNMVGHLVPVTTDATPDTEVVIAHALGRVPRLVIPALNPSDVGATLPQLAITRAADASFLYVSSPEANKRLILYVE